MTKREAIETAARTARVFARRTGQKLTAETCWDAIAELPEGTPAISAKTVYAAAKRELVANGDLHLI